MGTPEEFDTTVQISDEVLEEAEFYRQAHLDDLDKVERLLTQKAETRPGPA